MEGNSLSMLEALSSGAGMPKQQAQVVEIVAPNSAPYCPSIAPTRNNNIDLNNLNVAKPDVVEFELENTGNADAYVLLGCGVCGFTNSIAEDIGFQDLSISKADCEDQFGSNTPKVQFFNATVTGAPIVVGEIAVQTDDDAQFAQGLQTVSISLNGDKYATKAPFTKIDKDLNYAVLEGCPVPFSFYQGMLYKLLAGKRATISMKVLGYDAIGNFTPKLEH
jgi:hypothetical protein